MRGLVTYLYSPVTFRLRLLILISFRCVLVESELKNIVDFLFGRINARDSENKMAERPFKKVLIIGAGPSGLLLALLLQKHGIEVKLLEAADTLDSHPRAAYYGPAAIPDLHRGGIMEEVRRRGISPTTMYWRRPEDFSVITGMDTAVLDDVDGLDCRTACLVLQDLDQLMLDRFVEHGGEVKWNHKVVSTGQDGEKAWVDVETPEGNIRVEADYLVGCDGAASAVRRSLFGTEYPGFTWDKQIVATNVSFTLLSGGDILC